MASEILRLVFKRRDWGDEQALAYRARALFGLIPTRHHSFIRAVRLERVNTGRVAGERVVPRSVRDPSRTLLYLHGGGYVACSPATHRAITCALAAGLQAEVFAPRYRLAPEHRFPAAVDDAVEAYRWVLARAVRPERISIAGDSAGGGLVLAALMKARAEGLPMPSCAVCICPWTDLVGSGASVERNASTDPFAYPSNIAAFAAAYLGTADPSNPLASPLEGDLAGLPPLLVQASDSEILLDDAVRLHERALGVGVASTLSIHAGLPHVWHQWAGLVPEAATALDEICAFVSERWRT